MASFHVCCYGFSQGRKSLYNTTVSVIKKFLTRPSWDMIKRNSDELGYDQRLYALHSFSSRGAASIETKLRKNPSRKRLLKLHSRWKSDSAEDMYVKEQVQERLDVDKIAGI